MKLWKLKQCLKRLLLFPFPAKCRWHLGDCPINWGNEFTIPYCPDCGRLLDTKTCQRCGKDFIDLSARGYDDVFAAPTITEGGDIVCEFCAQFYSEEDDFEDEKVECKG